MIFVLLASVSPTITTISGLASSAVEGGGGGGGGVRAPAALLLLTTDAVLLEVALTAATLIPDSCKVSHTPAKNIQYTFHQNIKMNFFAIFF